MSVATSMSTFTKAASLNDVPLKPYEQMIETVPATGDPVSLHHIGTGKHSVQSLKQDASVAAASDAASRNDAVLRLRLAEAATGPMLLPFSLWNKKKVVDNSRGTEGQLGIPGVGTG